MSSALTIRHTREDDTARKNAESNQQVKRYWPGKAPEWVDDEETAIDEAAIKTEEEVDDEANEAVAATRVAVPVIVKKKADPRLARLALNTDQEEDADDVAAPRIVSRRQARGESEEESEEEEGNELDSDEDDEEVEARRAAVRAKLQKRRGQEEEEVLAAVASEEEEEEEESEYETDTDEEMFGRQMLKPMFVTKKERETIAEREALEKEQLDVIRKEKQRLAARAHETKEILISRLQQEEEAAKAMREGPREVGDIDTDDEKDQDADYESWKLREYNRIRRDREERDRLREAEEEREMLKNMTPEERRKWERDNPREVNQGPKKTWKFMQKYWHKGAFYQDVSDNPHAVGTRPDDIFTRDFSAPTGEDKLNKEILPKVMQVKNFGRRGRTKYTHLLDQDTTAKDDYYAQEGMAKPKRRVAGTDQVFEKPKKFSK